MAAHLPTINFNPLAPVTPPPEHLSFRKPALPLSAQLKRKAAEANLDDHNVPMKRESPSTSSSQPTAQAKPTSIPTPSTDPSQPPMDPRYVAMVSRIAAYYQQRCQAISNAQQQRCQAWANMHRQKCQEMMQAAMLVVAWYIRDRIQRRRRRQKRHFRSGLRAQSTRSRVAKGEGVRRWVMNIPEGLPSPHIPALDDLADQEEAHFSMDKEPPPDKDSKLFEMADGMIRSQYRKIEVPILGVLGFEESESESESEADDDFDQPLDDELEEGEVEDYDDEEDDLDLYEDEDEEDGSEVVHKGTGTGTGSRAKNSGLSS
ncbi:hypothetical protein CGCF415_v013320 [Colletotrichum fructicola]|uniref:Uncharacterized protein n=1 Tax=Colletotrichum fructicola (strain Nara gc5) TaxID=1213859 RepID=L2FXG2_COLFN|nr:uncharacterized protein CGMCC3_g5009 [Colletotrichum fructicola]KAI8287771.1 hypothetical protein K4K60_012064 [Colletotrichum sp. SAR11_57]KAE9578892.1 hypothetical protein CGMCC3_g5009 [Colletotrichum fructicola]KAF4423209.1 hypothetical protein CFRS1_v004689 [Colletotrichum fructicola]KAF4885283.1 hypothetical protein CGCFRS4_v012072 [Colletotrichum fructicola]KAF4891578.1 hypothetical protein CGCF415_v013320 [Colletotrichum fructicola]